MIIDCDVAVIGGGSAGVAAAVAAARKGARVVLLERHGYLGGAGTASLVHTFCGLYFTGESPSLAHPGLPSEITKRLIASGVAQQPVRMGRVYVLPHHPLLLASWYDDFCTEMINLDIWLHTEVVQATVQDRLMVEIDCLCRGSRRTLKARSFVDASGDAVLAEMAGQPWSMVTSSELQRPAYIASVNGAPEDLLKNDGAILLAGQISLAVRRGDLSKECLGAHFRNSRNKGEIFITLDLPCDGNSVEFDPLSPECLTHIENTGRATIHSLLRVMPALAGCWVSAWPIRAGVRESRRWQGRYELSESDILNGTSFEDGVALVTWPMEVRERATGPRLIYPTALKPAEIPLRSLRAAALDNVFTAGRCISSSHRAQASTRVMGTALATGQAAGIAASDIANSGPNDSIASSVRKTLSDLPLV